MHMFAQTWRLHYQEMCTLEVSPKGRYANSNIKKMKTPEYNCWNNLSTDFLNSITAITMVTIISTTTMSLGFK